MMFDIFKEFSSLHFALLAVDWFLLYKLYPCGWVWDVASLIFDSPGWCSVRYTCWWRVALCRHLFAFSALRRAIQSAGPLARLEAAVKYLSAPRSYQRYHRNLLFFVDVSGRITRSDLIYLQHKRFHDTTLYEKLVIYNLEGRLSH